MKLPIIFSSLVVTAMLSTSAQAETKTLYMGAYGGSTEKLMMEEILPAWEKANDVKVVYVPGNSTKTLAKLQAQKGNQELDVVFLDDGPMYKAVALGFCDNIKDASVFNDIYDIAKMGTEKAVGLGFVVTGLAYDTEVFKKNGWDAPNSWADLSDPKYKGKVVVPPISNTYGLHALIMTARLHGGGEKNIEPGFKQFIDKVAPNVLAFEPSSGKLSELFQNKEVALATWGSGRMKSLIDTGFSGGFAYPKEGGVALMVATCPVVESDVPELSQSLIQYLLTADIQKKIAEVKGWGPTNTKTVLPKELADSIPYGPEKINALNAVDWNVINPVRDAWTKQWSRQVEK